MIDAVRRLCRAIDRRRYLRAVRRAVAHEDHPQRALYAALRMQDELKRHSDRVRAEGGLPIQAPIGVNAGEVVVRSIQTGAGRIEYTPIGHTTNLAWRMQTAASVGSIAVTEATCADARRAWLGSAKEFLQLMRLLVHRASPSDHRSEASTPNVESNGGASQRCRGRDGERRHLTVLFCYPFG
jgi:class 3 adenylate cyclase